jgi:N-methylhydantoinase A
VLLLGVDVGGTFTDIILADTEKKKFAIHKTLTTSQDPSQGVIWGITELCARERIAIHQLDHLLHGTTVATNAILEYKGAKTGMITTKGYRDILHIGRHQRPQNYSIMQDIAWQVRPLVRRRHRKVVEERLVPPVGDVLVPLDEPDVRRQIRALKEEGVESIAVCFLFSYLNSKHEDRVCELIREEYPEAFVTGSAEVSPQFREFERFTTAAMNAFLGPKVKSFIDRLSKMLTEAGARSEMHIMTSNGGVATARTIAAKPVYTLLSGPAAGVLGGQWVSRTTGRKNLITFDVGGTSADIGIVTATGIAEASARDTRIAQYPVMVPMIDIHTIGAGGGSIAYVDSGGAFRVGPRSAGSSPGPACYGRGGDEPTVTDANIVLGRLDKDHFLGGSMNIDPERSFAVIQRLAAQLQMDIYEAAEGVNTILASNMANAIRSRTVQKGHDPRKFALVAFGGAGPLHAVEVARHLKIPEAIVPVYPGLTSALGLLTTDLKYDFMKTEFMLSTNVFLHKLAGDLETLEREASSRLKSDGVPDERIQLSRSLDLRYVGQGYELKVSVPDGPLSEVLPTVWAAFHERHRSEYGHCFPDNPIEIVNLRVTATGLMPAINPVPLNGGSDAGVAEARIKQGEIYFRVDGKLRKVESTFFERSLLPTGATIEGPAVIFQHDSTTVLPPRSSATVDEYGNLLIETTKEF